MGNLIKSELRKILFKKRVLIVWALILFLSSILIRFDSSYPNYMMENYAALFDKTYGLAPVIGMLMLIVTSAMYTTEYNSNMTGLINTSKNGKRKVVIAKSIAGSIATSITTLTIYLTMVFYAIYKSNFKGLDLPLKELWYFGNSGSTITVLQMIIILGITLVLGCIVFTQITLLLSSISNNASMPFIVGGLIMGLPYIVTNFLPLNMQKYVGMTPLWGMYSQQLIRYKSPSISIGINLIFLILSVTVIYKLTFRQFINEKR